MKTHRLFVLATAIVAFLWTGSTGLASEPFHLGVALGASGTGAPYSKEAIEAIKLAVDEINAGGGFLGRHPIKLFIQDTQTRPQIARQVATDLIEKERVRAIIGTYSSACAIAIKPICRQNRVLHIATVSNSENITKVDFSPYTFSVVPNTYMMAKGVVMGLARLAREKGWKNYITIASDYAWGRSSQEIQIKLLGEIAPELNLLDAYWPVLGQTRFNSFVVAIMSQKPDFVLGTLGGADNALWMRDAKDYGFFKKIEYTGGLISVSELITQARSIRRGLYGRCRAPFFAHPDEPMMAGLVKNYKALYDRYPTDWAVMSYDGVYALKQGIQKAGSIDGDKIKAAMAGMTINTTRGRHAFRKIDNQLSCSAYFGRVADDPQYPIPIYHDMLEINGSEIWRPEAEIKAARSQ
jgi:branched-chain amino acid transport system substrate-binding protein